MSVIMETTLGDMIIDLYVEERPSCSYNFIKLCKMKYYNFCPFHFIQQNFIAQTGDPTGTGESGLSLEGLLKGAEFNYFDAELAPKINHTKLGLISMVNNGWDCHGSQFVLTLADNLNSLDGKHTVFGEIAENEGFQVLEKFNSVYCNSQGQPYQEVLITHTVIIDDPFVDPPGLTAPSRSPSPPSGVVGRGTIAAHEEVNIFKGMDERQIKELMDSNETKTNLQLLEVIGDITDADALPPENVLFVCKLNSNTTESDLGVIFSKFGPVLSSDIIRDRKTDDSLCYGFIEFENVEDCQNAYFKMDNVLIDDRRIHVDFCQSLAKNTDLSTYASSTGDSSSLRDHASRFDKHQLSKQYGLVFDDIALLQQAMSHKAKIARNRNKSDRYSDKNELNSYTRKREHHASGSNETHTRRPPTKQPKHQRDDNINLKLTDKSRGSNYQSAPSISSSRKYHHHHDEDRSHSIRNSALHSPHSHSEDRHSSHKHNKHRRK